MKMEFERLTDDGRLWAVKYDAEKSNVFDEVFSRWADVDWLKKFFSSNVCDLEKYFRITDVDIAIYDTIIDAEQMESLILDINEDESLDELFRPLENLRSSEMVLGKEKAKGRRNKHSSWLRLYALRLQANYYIITGGAIKLTPTMQEREHTLAELSNLNKVRDKLISLGIFDYDALESCDNETDK